MVAPPTPPVTVADAKNAVQFEIGDHKVGKRRQQHQRRKPAQKRAERIENRTMIRPRHRPGFPLVAWPYELDATVEGGRPMIARNSRRVDGSVRKAPSIRLVTMEVFGLWTPRVVMH